jgi:hypothetical protein
VILTFFVRFLHKTEYAVVVNLIKLKFANSAYQNMIDVGANIGNTSLLFLHNITNAKALAWSPLIKHVVFNKKKYLMNKYRLSGLVYSILNKPSYSL